jgi:hypothetical protein
MEQQEEEEEEGPMEELAAMEDEEEELEEEEEVEEDDDEEENPLLAMIVSQDGTDDASPSRVLEWVEAQQQQQQHNVASKWARKRDGEGWLPLHRALERPNCSPDLVRCLLQLYPESVKQRTDDDDDLQYLPIHVACAFQQPRNPHCVPLLRCLVEEWPRCLRLGAGDVDKSLPLALAVRNSLGLPAVQYLTGQWDQAVHRFDASGRLPIHRAVEAWGHASFEASVIEHLADLHPPSLLEPVRDDDEDNNGGGGEALLPLHMVARVQPPYHTIIRMVELGRIQSQMVGLVASLVEKAPVSVRVASRTGKFPVHCAIESGFPAQGVVHLLQQWPESVGMATADGSSLVHLAVRHTVQSPALVRLLVEPRPEALMEVDRRGRLPIHVAAACCDSADVVRYLVEQAPPSARRADAAGSLPLHLALGRSGGGGGGGDEASAKLREIVKALLQSFPESASHADGNGSLPLHIAVAAAAAAASFSGTAGTASGDQSRAALLGIVELLVDFEPGALRQADRNGRLPLHVAALNGAQGGGGGDGAAAASPLLLDVLFVLARQYPEPLYQGGCAATKAPRPVKRTKLLDCSQPASCPGP